MTDQSSIEQYIDSHRNFQENLLKFIDDEDNIEENYQNFNEKYEALKIKENRSELKIFLIIIANISKYHYRSANFFDKIERILKNCKDEITENFSDTGIYNLFKTTNRILLFLLEEKILKLNNYIASQLPGYYFYPELTAFYGVEPTYLGIENMVSEQDLDGILKFIKSDEFEIKRKESENHLYVCQLIRKDDIDNFVSYFNKNSCSVNNKIEFSVFDVNELSYDCSSYIEYACFYGSIQIFKYLYKNGATFNKDILNFAIHGRNPEIFNILEEQKIFKNNSIGKNFVNKAIQYYHNEVADYIQQNYIDNKTKKPKKKGANKSIPEIDKLSISFYNFQYFPENIDERLSNFLCNFGYFLLFKMLLKTTAINLNSKYSNKPLWLVAIENDHLEIFKYIFEENLVQINHVQSIDNHKNKGLLYMAIENENIQLVEYLLSQHNVDVNLKYFEYDCQLNEIEEEYEGIMEKYDKDIPISEIENKLDDVFVDESPLLKVKTPLYFAAERGYNKIVSLLLDNPKIDINLNSFEYQKIESYMPIENESDNSESDNSESDNSESDYYTHSFNLFLYKRIIKSPLIIVIENNDYETLKVLLSHRKIDINAKSRIYYDIICLNFFNRFHYFAFENKTALYTAIENDNNNIIMPLLLNSDIDLNQKSLIVDNDSMIFINNIGKKTIKDRPNIPSQIMRTSMEIASEKNNVKVINILLDKQDINFEDNKNIFINAIKNGNIKLYNKYLSNIDVIDESLFDGALQSSINKGNIEMVKVLLDRKDIDINSPFNGKTAIEIAAEVGDIDIFNLLISQPDIDINNINGDKSPLQVAIENRNIDIIKILSNQPGINLDPKVIFRNEDFDKMKIIIFLYGARKKENDPKNAKLWELLSEAILKEKDF